ncbi:MAG TPA: magnesium-translocating P-type ATPase [Burkholderiales bacterium]|nr:magnesium-translocating P-type ATPase [Burkholderiales bacterium]
MSRRRFFAASGQRSRSSGLTTTVDDAWWRKPLSECLTVLDASRQGLSGKEARRRLRISGPNSFQDIPKRSLVIQFLTRFKNPLVIILLVASSVSLLTQEIAGFAIINIIVILSVTLDFIQEYRAERAAERLRDMVAVHATVLRDATPRAVPVQHLVPGDVVLVAAGNLVPADGRVVESRDLFVNQSILTGEPYPVEKRPLDTLPADADLLSAGNALFMGTAVTSGTAKMLVCKTGSTTAIGQIAEYVGRRRAPTDFELGTRRFGLMIMRLTFFLVLFVLLVNALFHRPLLESLLFAIALAVGLTPELLPMVVTVTLSRGAIRMADKKVIVKRLASIQNLGSMDVLCTDKTGTLTEARIRVAQHLDAMGQESTRALQLAYLTSYFASGLKNPLDIAILEHQHIDTTTWKKIDEVPFDFERRRVSVLLDNGERRVLVVKGAPEDVMRTSTRYEESAGSIRELDAATLESIQTRYGALGGEGLKAVAVAWREIARDRESATRDDESQLVFAGFVAFYDPPKKSAAAALAALAQSRVQLKIITGDNEQVTKHLCVQLGIKVTEVLMGGQIAAMDDSALQAAVEYVNLFCRVTPGEKSRIIQALRARGHVVGYLGDGINDAPPLHSADVGLSVSSAVDVAKDAADMILLKRDLNVLHDGVEEGRRTFANIMKYIMMGTSSNFGNMFSMAGASLFLPFLPMLPTQILLNNILYDISEVAIPLDSVDAEAVEKPRHWDTKFIRNFMVVVGAVSSLFDFLTFYVLLEIMRADMALFQTGWFVESLATQVLVIFVIRTRASPFANRPHPLLAASSITVVVLAAVLPFIPIGAYFGFVQLPGWFFLILGGMVAAYLLLVQWVKRFFYLRLVPNQKNAGLI